MSIGIKARRVQRNIKVLDKTIAAAEKIKQSHVKAKDSIPQQTQEQSVPEEYAEDSITEGVDIAVHKAMYHVREQGGRLVGTVKEKRRISKDIKERKSEIQGEQESHNQEKIPLLPHSVGKQITSRRKKCKEGRHSVVLDRSHLSRFYRTGKLPDIPSLS